MATTVRSSSVNTAATGTAVSVSAPTGTAAGDLVIVTVHYNNNTTIVDNNGATPFTEDLNDYQQVTTGQTVSVFSRRIQAGDPSTYNFTGGSSTRWTATAVTWQNPHASIIYDVAPISGNSNQSGTAVATLTSLSINTTTNGAIHCVVCCPDNPAASIVKPTGYTEEQNNATNQAVDFSDKVIVSAGATGAQTWTWTGNAGVVTLSFAIMDIAASSGSIGGPVFDGRTFRGLTFGRVLGAPMFGPMAMKWEAERLWRRNEQLRRAA